MLGSNSECQDMIVDQILFTYQDNLLGYKSDDIILSQTQQEPVIFKNCEHVQGAMLEELYIPSTGRLRPDYT